MWTEVSDVDLLFLQLKADDEIERENSSYLLGELGAEALALTCNTLKNRKDFEKINALTNPETFNRAVDILIESTRDSVSWVRGNAAEALGKLKAKKAVKSLIKCLEDEEQVVRVSAAEALGAIGDFSATSNLSEMLTSEEWSLRMQAARALGKLGDPGAVEVLTQALKDDREDVSIAARESLDLLIDDSSYESSPGRSH